MAEFEEKLNSILGNQEAMGQIMALAQSLSGERPASATQVDEKEDHSVKAPGTQPDNQTPDLSALLGQIDPNMLQMGMRIIQQVQGNDDRNTALLNALRPFLREERQAKLDRAIQIARMTKLIRAALGALGGKGEEEVV